MQVMVESEIADMASWLSQWSLGIVKWWPKAGPVVKPGDKLVIHVGRGRE